MISHSASSVAAKDFSFVEGLARANFVGPGRLSERFRNRLRAFARRSECMLTNSGTAALEISLHVLRRALPKRRYVAVGSYVCPAVVSAIVREGLKPLFLDVMPDSVRISMESARNRIDQATLALICTNIGGIPDDYTEAERLGCPVVSDCAQGIGSSWAGRSIVELGQFAVFSFGPTKMLTAGVGGALLSNDETSHRSATSYATGELDVAEYRQKGFLATYGQCFSDLNAGLGLSQLQRMGAFVRKRQAIARAYGAVLLPHGIGVPALPSGAGSNCYRYYFLSDRSADWIALLRRAGIDARPSISHSMVDYFQRIGRLPNLRKNAACMVSLPIYPELTTRQVGKITDTLQRAVDKGLR